MPPYITEAGVHALRNYQYKGRDVSFLYNAAFRPLAKACAEYVPLTIAPNIITLAGLALSFVSFGLVVHYGYEVPRWLCVVCGINLFLYQLLDNMDGHQARRTGMASPLGQLFDHGCDAVNTTVSSYVFATALQLSPEQGMGFMVCGYVTFYFATWDEYHTEEMYLGPINGADEGVFLTYSFYFLTAVMGREAWLKPIAFGVPANIALTALSIVLSVGCWADAVRRVRAKRPTQIPAALSRLAPVAVFVAFALLWVCGPLRPEQPQMWVIVIAMGSVYAYIVCRLILAHVCKLPFAVHQPTLGVMAAAIANRYIGHWLLGAPLLPESLVNLGCMCVGLLIFGAYVLRVIGEITTALNIPCFTVTRAVKEAAAREAAAREAASTTA